MNTLRLRGSDFGSPVSCLGSQLATIVRLLSIEQPEMIWFAADVRCDSGGRLSAILEPVPVLIGTSYDLQLEAASVSQFYAGVFIGLRNPRLLAGKTFLTEDDVCAGFDQYTDVLIRAFDTSYFEICSDLDLRYLARVNPNQI
jgi:hypothetical protein